MTFPHLSCQSQEEFFNLLVVDSLTRHSGFDKNNKTQITFVPGYLLLSD